MPAEIIFDPITGEVLPDPTQYQIEPYDAESCLVKKLATGESYLVDFGEGTCTCNHFMMANEGRTRGLCRHLKLVAACRRGMRIPLSVPLGFQRARFPSS